MEINTKKKSFLEESNSNNYEAILKELEELDDNELFYEAKKKIVYY